MTSESPPKPVQFVNVGPLVYKGWELVARASSKTLAKRIANALNRHITNSEGV